MFNTTIIKQSESCPVPYEKSVTVVENRAPTEKSVQLLNEFQSKAFSNILSAGIIKDNHFEFAFMTYPCPASFDIKTIITFKLNGHKYEFEHLGLREESPKEIIDRFYKNLAGIIAEQIIRGLDKQHILEMVKLK